MKAVWEMNDAELNQLSNVQLERALYDLKCDYEHYRDREIDHKEDQTATILGIYQQMDRVELVMDTRFAAESKHYDSLAEQAAYDRMVEA